MGLYIGEAGLRGQFARYAQRFNALELRAELGTLPRPPRLREWRRDAPDAFRFSVQMPAAYGTTADVDDAAFKYAMKAADALRADWLVVASNPTLAPGPRGTQTLLARFERVRDAAERIAWAPAGPWDDEQSEAFARQAGVTLVRDAARFDMAPGDRAYTRLRALGVSAIRQSDAERAAERLCDFSDVTVIVDGPGAKLVQRVLGEELSIEPVEVVGGTDEA